MEAERQQSRTGCHLSKYVGSTELQEKLQHRGKEDRRRHGGLERKRRRRTAEMDVLKKREKQHRGNSDRLERSRQREDGGRFTFKRNWVLVGFANRSEHTDLIFLLAHIFPFFFPPLHVNGNISRFSFDV